MTPNQAARELLASLSLPYGTVSILPWHEDGQVTLHVMIDRPYVRSAQVPPTFEGFEVKLEERQAAFAHG